MAFYEGNDIPETHDYLLWKSGRWAELRGYLFRFATDSLSRRYIAAAMATLVESRKAMGALDEMFLQKLAIARGYPQRIHPDVAILNLGGKLYTKLFIDKLPETTTEQMLATDELRAIQSAFDDFREICQANRIAPVILYVPTALQIYEPYTATGSGSQWLAVRERQIAARRNIEKGIKFLAERSRVDFISLTPEFERAASRGKMIYYALDAHWNTEGREIAARFVGEFLKNNYSLS
jgi:hypothetical protein